MRAVFQRVDSASLKVDKKNISQIDKGIMVMLGVTNDDDIEKVKKMAYRIATTRIFRDENGKLNKNVLDVNGKVLLVSNFTLCVTKKGGTRPDFSLSASKEKALEYYDKLANILQTEYNIETFKGKFGEHMEINANLNGPITLFIET